MFSFSDHVHSSSPNRFESSISITSSSSSPTMFSQRYAAFTKVASIKKSIRGITILFLIGVCGVLVI